MSAGRFGPWACTVLVALAVVAAHAGLARTYAAAGAVVHHPMDIGQIVRLNGMLALLLGLLGIRHRPGRPGLGPALGLGLYLGGATANGLDLLGAGVANYWPVRAALRRLGLEPPLDLVTNLPDLALLVGLLLLGPTLCRESLLAARALRLRLLAGAAGRNEGG